MVYAIIVHLHSGKQRLWRGKSISGPAFWCQAGLDMLFLLGWLAGEYVLRSEDTNACSPLESAHDARFPQALADSPHFSGSWVGPPGLLWLLRPYHRHVCTA
jgi:hypothetical protein